MEQKKILYAKPSITEHEISVVTDAIRNGWGEACYEYIKKFETEFARKNKAEFALSTSSCTGALHLVLRSLNIGPGDEVIVPDCTWIASIAPITYLGATPIFVDIDPVSWCIDPNEVKKKISPKTKAVIAVHLYGNLCDMDALQEVCKTNNLFLIEDAAEALGSKHKDRPAGSIGDFGVFSFHGTKTITTGEGGMVITSNPKLFANLKTISDHGRNPQEKRMFWCEQIGMKYKMSNLQAALGYAQLSRSEELVAKKRSVFAKYQKELASISGLTLNHEGKDHYNSYWMPTAYCSFLNLAKRDQLIAEMNARGIAIRPFFYPITSMDLFPEHLNYPNCTEISQKSFNLPSYFEMTDEDVSRVVTNLKDVLEKIR